MILRAYAKINIGLRILRKRSDGYHDIETVFHQIDLWDELTFERAETVVLTTSSPEIPHDSSNLCVRAAQLFLEQAGHKDGVAIVLRKQIPVGAGLGGGSSDAASVLIALDKLWNSGLSHSDLQSLASQLGSDIPFFIQGGTAVGTSRGEVLEHFDLSIPYWIVTATPRVNVLTSWAYSNITVKEPAQSKPLRTLVQDCMANPGGIQTHIHNDFEELVFRTHPEIRQLKDSLTSAGAIFAQLSGSGSSVYGLFEIEAAARSATAKLATTCTTSITAPNFRPSLRFN